MKHTFESLTASEWHAHGGEVHSGPPDHTYVLNVNQDRDVIDCALRNRLAQMVCRDRNSHDKLLEALREIRDAETTCCPRCEGNGNLYADGKGHYMHENAPTINCGNCGGSGRLQPENAQEIAQAAISLAEKGTE